MKKISRRDFLMATGAVAAASTLAACSGSTGSTGASSTAASTAPASSAASEADASKYEVTAPITITWWHALESQYDELVADVVKKFNASQSLITVEAQYMGAYKDINEALVAAHAAGSGLPAVAVANTDYVASYGESGLFENLDPYISATGYDTDDFSAGLLLSSQCGGKQVALPFLHSTQVIYYNKTMADKLGLTVPEKIEDFPAFLEAAKASGVYGTVVPGWDQWYFETLYLNEGVEIITADNTCDLDSDIAQGVTAMIKDWCDKGLAYFATGTDASATMRQNFYDGKTLSVMHTSSLYNNYVSKCPDFEVGMAWYPAASTGEKNSEVGGCVLGIPSKNDQATKNAAWQFLQFLCGKEVNMQWAEGTGYLPTRNSVLTTDEGKEFLKKKPDFQCIFDNLNLINPRIQNSAWSELATTWKNYMDIIMNQGGDVASNSADMVVEINEILEDHA
ncbi:MAG: ABC transporter substrate-binding protein [Faecalibacterium sp.]